MVLIGRISIEYHKGVIHDHISRMLFITGFDMSYKGPLFMENHFRWISMMVGYCTDVATPT